jgi:hypothetical protein
MQQPRLNPTLCSRCTGWSFAVANFDSGGTIRLTLRFFTRSDNICDTFDVLNIFLGVKADTDTPFSASSPRAASAMNVRRHRGWDVVIDNHVHTPEVNATRKEICGNQNPNSTLSKILHDG